MARAIGILLLFWSLLAVTALARQQFFDDDVPGLEYKPPIECAPCECESEVG